MVTWTQNMQRKQTYCFLISFSWYRWKRYCSMTRRNSWHFPTASGQMRPNSICLWRHREHGDNNKRWRPRQFGPSQDMVVTKIIMCHRNLFLHDLRVCTELQVLSKSVSGLWFYAYKKYKNGNSARRTSHQRHIQLPISYGGSDNFSSRISRKLPK